MVEWKQRKALGRREKEKHKGSWKTGKLHWVGEGGEKSSIKHCVMGVGGGGGEKGRNSKKRRVWWGTKERGRGVGIWGADFTQNLLLKTENCFQPNIYRREWKDRIKHLFMITCGHLPPPLFVVWSTVCLGGGILHFFWIFRKKSQVP